MHINWEKLLNKKYQPPHLQFDNENNSFIDDAGVQINSKIN